MCVSKLWPKFKYAFYILVDRTLFCLNDASPFFLCEHAYLEYIHTVYKLSIRTNHKKNLPSGYCIYMAGMLHFAGKPKTEFPKKRLFFAN